MLNDEHPFWGKVLALAGQEIHAAVSRALGVGAPNSVDTTVAAARERVRIPRPKREAVALYKPGEDRVLAALTDEPATAQRIADRIGEAVKMPVDMRGLASELAKLVGSKLVVATGERRGKRYAAVPVEPSDGDVA
jgi:hypothetical protein